MRLILYRFRVIAGYLSKVVNLYPPILHQKILSPWAIVWRYLSDPTFSRFDTTLECNRHTDRQTHTDT